MAESTVGLLVADAAVVPRAAATGRHHHAFWQLDHCDGGVITAVLVQGTEVLRPGHGLLLPPGVAHDFRYRAGSRYVSWKFTCGLPAPSAALRLDRQPGWGGLAAALAARPAEPAVPHLLAAALALALEGPAATSAGFAAEVARLVDARPAWSWSVQAVAAGLGLSPGHASARMQAETGMPLKRWLDVHRAGHAGRALAASDLGVADVAARCGFPDQFAFSRFFRRVTGEPPSAFRARRIRG